MSAIAALVLNDGAATPVAHTFTPIGVPNGVAKWQDISGGFSIGFPTVTSSVRLPTKTSKVTKVVAKVVFPVTEILSPSTIPTKQFDLLASVEFVLPERASQQNRKDLFAFVTNLLAAASPVKDAVQTLAVTW